MSRSKAPIFIILIAVLVPAIMATAERDRSKRSQENGESNGMAMMNTMQMTCNSLAEDFDALNHHFGMMAQITDPELLQSEMKHHGELMQKLYETVTEQKKMCDEITNGDHHMMQDHDMMERERDIDSDR